METRKLINGEMLTLDETTNKNIKLIWSIANRYMKKGKHLCLEPDDLFGIASIGFVKAFQKFDPEKFPVKFSTYAVPMMVGEILRHFRDNTGDLKFSRSIYEIANKISKAEMEDEPIDVLMMHFDEDEPSIAQALYYLKNKKATSLQTVTYVGKGQELTLEEQIPSKNVLSDFSQVNVNEFLETLPERDRKIIELSSYGLTQGEIGKIIGISQVQVGRSLKKYQSQAESFFGYRVGYFQERPATNTQKEEREMKKKIKKTTSRSQKGDLERAKELLATTDWTPCKVSKETGINDSSAYYWAKKIREPQVEEAPVVVSHIKIEEKGKEVKCMENENKIEFGVPELTLDGGQTVKAIAAVNQEEEKRKSVLSKSKRSFKYEVTSNDVSPSEIHTIFTQVGHAASASGLDKLNVNVAVTTEQL